MKRVLGAALLSAFALCGCDSRNANAADEAQNPAPVQQLQGEVNAVKAEHGQIMNDHKVIVQDHEKLCGNIRI